MQIERSQLPCPEAEFRAKFADYERACEAHRDTVGVPAPFPEHEVFRALYENAEPLQVVDLEDGEAPRRDADRDRALKRQAAIEALLVQAASALDAPLAVKEYAGVK